MQDICAGHAGSVPDIFPVSAVNGDDTGRIGYCTFFRLEFREISWRLCAYQYADNTSHHSCELFGKAEEGRSSYGCYCIPGEETDTDTEHTYGGILYLQYDT